MAFSENPYFSRAMWTQFLKFEPRDKIKLHEIWISSNNVSCDLFCISDTVVMLLKIHCFKSYYSIRYPNSISNPVCTLFSESNFQRSYKRVAFFDSNTAFDYLILSESLPDVRPFVFIKLETVSTYRKLFWKSDRIVRHTLLIVSLQYKMHTLMSVLTMKTENVHHNMGVIQKLTFLSKKNLSVIKPLHSGPCKRSNSDQAVFRCEFESHSYIKTKVLKKVLKKRLH